MKDTVLTPSTRAILTILVALAVPAAALPLLAGDEPIEPIEPGTHVADFRLADFQGAEQSLQDALGSSKLVIVDFWSTRCPVSRSYEERLTAIANDYAPRGVRVLAIMSNQTENAADVKEYVAEHDLPYNVLIDTGSRIADRFGAQTTPHVFVLDPSGMVRYAGGIDDGAKDASQLKPYLREALDAILDGGEPAQARTRNFGCSIKRKA